MRGSLRLFLQRVYPKYHAVYGLILYKNVMAQTSSVLSLPQSFVTLRYGHCDLRSVT